MSVLGRLVPVGFDRFLDWRRRFRAAGRSSLDALRAAGSRERRRALAASRIEQLPPRIRSGLDCVVDVGANQGQWSEALLSVARPSRLELFEPNPEAFAMLERRLGAYPGARLHPFAIGESVGELTLHVTAHSDFASFLTPADELARAYGSEATTIQRDLAVRVDTLDRVLADRPTIDLLKIDVQGFEARVLAGASESLRKTRALLVEANLVRHYEGDDSFGRLADRLEGLGFGVWDLSPPFRSPDGRALWCDVAFVQRALVPEG